MISNIRVCVVFALITLAGLAGGVYINKWLFLVSVPGIFVLLLASFLLFAVQTEVRLPFDKDIHDE